MAFIVTSHDAQGGSFRQKFTHRQPAIEKFERLFGGRFEAAIAAFLDGTDPLPDRHSVVRVEANGTRGRVTFTQRD